ncbi:MAG TPA: APC family permease [Candidatus Dormibacteraeota bacterium]|jgi:amino acid transporter
MAARDTVEVDGYVGGGLSKETNWWGAFVVGLAGTILVLGVTPPVLAGLGSAALPNFLFWSLTGWLLCMFLAEMAAMLPERTGGAPAYAYYAFRERLPRAYPHINGVTAWMYWLGWFPVVAVNMLLTGAYLPVLFGFTDRTRTFQLLSSGAPVSVFTLAVGAFLAVLLLSAALMGIRFGTRIATVLAVITIVPLTLMALLPFFHPSSISAGHILPLRLPDGSGFLTGTALFLFLQFSALFTWNVIAMEAAACYIGECRDPARDAPIAMNLEGGYGVFIYTVLPFSVLAVVGIGGVKADPLALFAGFAGRVVDVPVIARVVTVLLIVALALSSLNAIMGCARSLHQMSLDGQAPRILSHVNRHNVPDAAMSLNVVLNIFLIFFGAPATIYIFSNVGYVGSFVPVLLGYYFLRRWHPDLRRPYRLPEWMKYLALGLAALYFVVWAAGIPACAIAGCVAGGGFAYLVGLAVVGAYFPLYWWRRMRDRRRAPDAEPAPEPAGVTLAGVAQPLVGLHGVTPTGDGRSEAGHGADC